MSTDKFQYWPSDGQLGSTKFTIPTNAEDWPSGDALVGNFVYKEGELVDLINTKALIVNDSKKTTINYDYVDISLPCIGEGDLTIIRGSRSKYFNVKWGTTIEPETPKVELQPDAIWKPTSITSSNVYKLKNISEVQPYYMVKDGLNYEIDLSGVTSIAANVIPASVKKWNHDLPALNNITNVAIQSTNNHQVDTKVFSDLESFDGDLSSLENASGLFMDNNNLSHFSGNLDSLRCGYVDNHVVADFAGAEKDMGMFINTDLDLTSLQNIADALPDRATTPSFFAPPPGMTEEEVYSHTYRQWTIGISWHSGAKNKTSANKQQILNIFSQIVAKGWTIYTNSDLTGTLSNVYEHREWY